MPSSYSGTRDVKKEHYNMGVLLTDKAKEEILKETFKKRVGYDLDLENPKSFNEKIMWFKLYYQDPLMTKCCDKFAVKEYVDKTIGPGHVVPTIAAWDNPDEIDFDALPEQFVLKVNWSSGYNIIVKDKAKLDQEKTKRQLKRWMSPDRNSYFQFFNWGYKHMKPVVYAEEYIEQVDGQVYDYKFHVFNGKTEVVLIATDRDKGIQLSFDFFDREFNHLPFTRGGVNADILPEKPKHYDEMLELAEKLAKPFPFVRVDFYEIGDRVLLGEMTFYPGGGLLAFDPVEWDYRLGDMFALPKKLITDKPGVLGPLKVLAAKIKKSILDWFRKIRCKVMKNKIINKKHYAIIFGKIRIPFVRNKRYIKLEGLEIRKKNGSLSMRTSVSGNKVPKFQFLKMGPALTYAMEDKITLDMKKHYCEQKGYKQLKYFPNLTDPQTFNEKLLWLAIYYKNPNYSIASDKARAKDWIGERVGYEYTVPVIGVYDDINAIDFDALPDKFAIKANNGWGANEVVLIRNKGKCDIDNLKAVASSWLYPWKFYYYNNMCITDEKPEKPMIVIEKLLENEDEEKIYLNDYKLYCCNGKVKFSMVVCDRGSKQQTRTFVDADWKTLPIRRAGKFSSSAPEKPQNYEKMVELAETLAKDIPFVRIDFYNIDGRIYVGELTFTPGLFLRFEPKGADEFLGKYLDISDIVRKVNAKKGMEKKGEDYAKQEPWEAL